MSNLIIVEINEGVATVTLNRPEAMNALSKALRARLFQVMTALDADDGVRAVVLTGAGTRAFTAGLDLKELGSEAGALGALTSDPATARDVKSTLANLRFVSEQLAQKQGLLGAMINDPELATRFRRILTQVSRAIEDAREAAPIGSFIQVLIGYW